jgi:hypothetical protein
MQGDLFRGTFDNFVWKDLPKDMLFPDLDCGSVSGRRSNDEEISVSDKKDSFSFSMILRDVEKSIALCATNDASLPGLHTLTTKLVAQEEICGRSCEPSLWGARFHFDPSEKDALCVE